MSDPSPAGSPGPVGVAQTTVVPAYASRPSSPYKLFLDFDGINFAGNWGDTGRAPGVVPRYSTDGDTSSFSPTELTNIRLIWSRVADAFSQFNVDVTTTDPGTPTAYSRVRVVIGGNNAWWGGGGGVAYIAGYTYADASYGTGWVFPGNLGGGSPKFVSDAAIHEAGHLFGVYHQQQRNPDGSLAAEYRTFENDAATAPIMGVAYNRDRGTWSNGTVGYSGGSFIYQDDLAQIASTSSSPYNHPFLGTEYNNNFGYAADDYGNTIATATAMTLVNSRAFSVSGVIERTTDVDMFSFTTFQGLVTLTALNAEYLGMLDVRMWLYDSTGTLLADVNPPIDTALADDGLDASWSGTLAAGLYYVAVGSAGGYGDIGQFTLRGTVISGPIPEPAALGLIALAAPMLGRRRR